MKSKQGVNMIKSKFQFMAALIFFPIFLISGYTVNIFYTGTSKNISKVENFTLNDYNGKSHSLKDFKDSKAIVVMFIATRCPVSNAYNKRMENIYNEFKDKGISFIGINANKAENVDEIKAHAKEHGLTFLILKDMQNKIADEFEASVTPEIYVLNSNFEVQYHGRIDDSREADNVENKDLENALKEILAGKKVLNSRTKAFGCSIKRVEA